MIDPERRERTWLVIVVLAILLVLTAVLVDDTHGQEKLDYDGEHYYPRNLEDWTRDDWDAMSDRDRWFLLHGYFMAAMIYHNSIQEVATSPTDVRATLERFVGVFSMDVDTLRQTMTDYYESQDGPMMAVPMTLGMGPSEDNL